MEEIVPPDFYYHDIVEVKFTFGSVDGQDNQQ